MKREKVPQIKMPRLLKTMGRECGIPKHNTRRLPEATAAGITGPRTR
jgi:hypothetical protein